MLTTTSNPNPNPFPNPVSPSPWFIFWIFTSNALRGALFDPFCRGRSACSRAFELSRPWVRGFVDSFRFSFFSHSNGLLMNRDSCLSTIPFTHRCTSGVKGGRSEVNMATFLSCSSRRVWRHGGRGILADAFGFKSALRAPSRR